MKSWCKKLVIATSGVLLGFFLIGPLLLKWAGEKMIATGPNGPGTPATVGLPYEHLKISSGGRLLDTYLVWAAEDCHPRAALLIFHGVGETISQWVGVQRLLYDHCISSLIFDYSGDGDSTGRGSVENLNQDAPAAYEFFAARFGSRERLCILGFSMGNAPMLDSVGKFRPPPSCIVVASAFSSGRDSAKYHWKVPRLFMKMVPDPWDNVHNVSQVRSSLLVLHSDADQVNPLWMGRRIFEAAPAPKQLMVVHGLRHNAAYKTSNEQWWGPVIQFVRH